MISAGLWLILAAAPTLSVAVDLTEAPRRLIHAHLTMPAAPGPMTLVYPKWIPGEHGPTGPLADVSGLTFRAGGKALTRRRDPEDLHALTLEVPAGASELSVDLTLISPPPHVDGFSSGSSTTANLAVLSWNQVLLLPKGAAAGAVECAPSLKLPAGWTSASALASAAAKAGQPIAFAKVSAETLVDSPVLAGAYLTVTPLGTLLGAPVSIAVAAETPGEGKLSERDTAALKRLVAEEAALYGARHFDRYVFLLTVSDDVPSFGLEHHQSSDNRLPGQVLVDPELGTADLVPLLAHESTHSWNGKFRRPQGLSTPDYQAPVHSELLWIYEGLTQYLGTVLSSRSRAWDLPTLRDGLALTAERQRQQVGRSWRPLEDTATAAQLLYGARRDWSGLRRSVDFYDEGTLIWLEVEATLRERTGGAKGLDEVVQAFHGGPSTGPQLKPYTLDEVLAALNAVAPFDWKGLLLARVQGLSADAPLQGLEKAGWRLAYTATEPALLKASEKEDKAIDLRSAIGLLLDADTFAVRDVVPGSAADKAGMAPGMKLLAVNQRKVTPERLMTSVEQTKGGAPLTFVADNAETFRTYTLEYKGGLRYPVLEAIPGKADLLEAIARPRAAVAK
jgi:predicted metalloprotease with PDZ domain